ncbi:hypothetical protein [Nitrospira sp. Nam74]
MLHRLALRLLPSLTVAVTEEPVRKRKRWVMMAPGLVAFVVYRAAKWLVPLSDPLVLLAMSGLVSAVTAVWAYRVGRARSLASVWREDGIGRFVWLVGWIGFTYGVQLSLLVLALLKILAHYDFLHHPDGPAMMAIIIACTSVARDAFEIGYVRRLQQDGKPILTFPDGEIFRRYLREQPYQVLRWAVLGAVTCVTVAVAATRVPMGQIEVVQFAIVTLVAGTVTILAYMAGEQRPGGWQARLSVVGWAELFRFWWWPGLAFAATYYLVISGIVTFVLRWETETVWLQGLTAGLVAVLMSVYSYFLGGRRYQEDRIHQVVPPSLLRCPFVMGLLSKKTPHSPETALTLSEPILGESRQQG